MSGYRRVKEAVLRKRRPCDAAEYVAAIRRMLGDDDSSEGLALCEVAVAEFPKDAELRLLHGVFLADIDHADAARVLAQAVALDPNNPVIVVRAGRQLVSLGYVDAAESYANHAAGVVPDDWPFRAFLISLQARVAADRGRDDLAEPGLREAIALEPSNEGFVKDLAEYLFQRGRVSEARAVIDDAVADVSHPEVLYAARDTIIKSFAD